MAAKKNDNHTISEDEIHRLSRASDWDSNNKISRENLDIERFINNMPAGLRDDITQISARLLVAICVESIASQDIESDCEVASKCASIVANRMRNKFFELASDYREYLESFATNGGAYIIDFIKYDDIFPDQDEDDIPFK